MRKKNKYTPKVPAEKRKRIFSFWLANPNTTNAQMAAKFDLTGRTIDTILTNGLQQCKQK